MDKFILNNGLEIPVIGIGSEPVYRKTTWNAFFLQSLKQFNIGVKAPRVGCSLFDTSSAYGYSELILGMSHNFIKRSDIFITTKLSNTNQRDGDVRKALLKSLKNLQTDYIDLYLMHWPNPETYLDCWKQMEELYDEGLVKAIGVSNFHELCSYIFCL